MSVVNLIRHCYQVACTVVVVVQLLCVFSSVRMYTVCQIGIYKYSFCQAYLCFFSYACTLFISSLDIKKDNKNILCIFSLIQRRKYDQQYIFLKKTPSTFSIFTIFVKQKYPLRFFSDVNM